MKFSTPPQSSPATVSQIFKISVSLAGPKMNVCIQMEPSLIGTHLPAGCSTCTQVAEVLGGRSLHESRKGTQVAWNTIVPSLSLPSFQLCLTGSSCPHLTFLSVSSHLSLRCCIWHGLQRPFLGGCTNNVHISSGDSDSTHGALALCPALLTSKESRGGEESPLGAVPRKDSASQICLELSHSFMHPVNIC